MVRAKFKLNSVASSLGTRRKRSADGSYAKDGNGREIYEPCEVRTLTFNPVYGNGDPNHENSKFWDASPGGELKMNCVNQEAWERFELGKEYYLDFSPSPVV